MVRQLLFLGLVLAAGTGLFFAAVNRTLGIMRDGSGKKWILGALLVGIVGGVVLLAYLLQDLLGFWLPFALVSGLLVGEVHRLWLGCRYRTPPPIENEGQPASIRHPLTTTDLHIVHYQTTLPGLKLDQLRIVHLSDLHLDDGVPLAYFEHVMRRANQANPDLILITGDFVSHQAFIHDLPELLGILQARLGIFAIRGNHDYWADADQVTTAVEQSGVEIIPPGGRLLRLEDRQNLILVGCEQPWGAHPCAVPPLKDGDLAIALSHSADYVYRLGAKGVQAVFSGHYHAGQFCLPWGGVFVIPGAYGRRFTRGHFYVRGVHLFVSAGIGSGHPPFRIYCPPDFFVVDFKGKT